MTFKCEDDICYVSEENLKRIIEIHRKLAKFVSKFNKDDIMRLSSEDLQENRYNSLSGFSKLDDDFKRLAFGIINPVYSYIERYNGGKSMEEFSDDVKKGIKKIIEMDKSENLEKNDTVLSFYLACRMLKLYPKTEKFKEFKRRVEEYLGVEPY